MVSIPLDCGRRAARKVVDLRCTVTPRKGPAREMRMTELSQLGGFIRTTKPLPIGSLLRVRFMLPTRVLTEVRAEVMWTRVARDGKGAGMGVELVAAAPEVAAHIAEALAGRPNLVNDATRFTFRDMA